MPYRNIALTSLALALLTSGCATKKPEPVLAVKPTVSHCPLFVIPDELLTRPIILNFLEMPPSLPPSKPTN